MAHKGSSSACQNKVILINKSLPVGRFKAPMPVKGLREFSLIRRCVCAAILVLAETRGATNAQMSEFRTITTENVGSKQLKVTKVKDHKTVC